MSEPKWITIAKGEIGVKEKRGGENPRIIEYHKATSLKAGEDEIAWCSAFVNWVLKKSGYKGTNSAAARSWLKYGTVTKVFKANSIVVFKRGSSTWQGHVAFAIADKGTHIKVLGGNQSDQVCYALYPKAKILGYTWPVEQPVIMRAKFEASPKDGVSA